MLNTIPKKYFYVLLVCTGIFVLSYPVLAGDYRVPDTGQTKCYDNKKEISCPGQGKRFYGQDANYTVNPPSFTKLDDQGDELPDSASRWSMVRDNNTGLVWEAKTNGNKSDWQDAVNYCSSLNLRDFSDWHLPTRQELQTIVDYGKYNPAIDTKYFPDTVSGGYWSSSTYKEYAWLVNFSYGYVPSYNKSKTYYVRCVRGGQ